MFCPPGDSPEVTRSPPVRKKEVVKKRHSEEFIVSILKEKTLYNWRKKYEGMTVSELRKLRSLTAIPGAEITRFLDALTVEPGDPQYIRVDTGPEICGRAFRKRATAHGVTGLFIEPGKPQPHEVWSKWNTASTKKSKAPLSFLVIPPHTAEYLNIRVCVR